MDPTALITGDKGIYLSFDQTLQPHVQRGVDAAIMLHQLLSLLTQLLDKVRCNIGHLLGLTQH
ncbi:hypothetical protein D3C85_1655510 [compost metagenome]